MNSKTPRSASPGWPCLFLVIAMLAFPGSLHAEQNDFATYVSREFGISFELPGSWKSRVENGALVFAGPRDTEQWKTTINLQVVQPGNVNLAGFVDDFKSQWQTLDEYRLLSEETGTLAGRPAVRLVVEYKVPQVSWGIRQEQVIIQHRKYYYTLAFTAPVELFEQHQGIMARVRGSLRFADQALEPDPVTVSAQELQQRLETFIQSVQEFRESNGLDGFSGWQQFANQNVQRYITMRNEDIWPAGDEDAGWAYFFSQSISTIGRLTDKISVVGFYHPWSDVWLVTQWQKGPEPQLLSAKLILGEWLRTRDEKELDMTPQWLRGKGFRPEQLARAVTGNLQEFDELVHAKQDWKAMLQLLDPNEFLLRLNYPAVSNGLLFSWFRAMETWNEEPSDKIVADLTTAALSFIEAGKTGQLKAEMAFSSGTNRNTFNTLASQEPDFFELLNPVYWTADDKRATLYLVPGLNSDFCLTLTYVRGTAGLLLDRVDLLHFPDLMKLQSLKGPE